MADTTPLTNLEYIKGKLGIEITDEAIKSIFTDRNIDAEGNAANTSKKLKELCLADAYMWCATLPSTSGSVKDADGNWSHEEGSQTLSTTDKKLMRAEAIRIYKMYGEYKGTTIKFNSSGFSLCRRKF